MRFHIDTSAKSLAINTLTDMTDGKITGHEAMCRLDGAANFAGRLPYGDSAAMALVVLAQYVALLDSIDEDPDHEIERMRDRLNTIFSQPTASESDDPAAVTFSEALANQGDMTGDFWAGVQ